MIKRYGLSIGITALLYFLVAKLVFSSLQLGIEPAPLWPPAGIALFVLLHQGRQVWIGVTIGILLIGHWLGVAWPLAIGSALGGTAEAVVGVTLLQRSSFHKTMDRLSDVLNFIGLAGLAAPLVNATISTGTGLLFQKISWMQVESIWWTFWLGDSMGILVFTPLLLVCAQLWQSQPSLNLFPWLNHRQRSEWLLCFSLLIGVSWLVFHSRPSEMITHYPIEYLPFPFVIWAALRLGQAMGILASFLLCMIAVTGTIANQGPFFIATTHAPQQLMLLQQAFIGVITMTALVVGAMTRERRHMETLLRQSQASLARAQQLARLGSWEFDFAQQQWSWSDELYRLLGLPVQEIAPSPKAFLQAVHVDDRSRVQKSIHQAIAEHLSYRMDYRLSLPDGTERIVEEQVVVGEANITGTILDITEYKQTEEKLRLNAERNRLLNEIALRIRRSLDLDEILNTTAKEVRQLLQADRVLICRFDATGHGEVVAESVLPGWTSALGWTSDPVVYAEIQAMFANSHICVVNDTSQNEYTPFIRHYHDRYQIKAGIGVAIILNPNSRETGLPDSSGSSHEPAQLFGLIVAHQCARPRQWQPLEIELFEQLATQVTIAIQQGQLYQRVQHLNSNLEEQVIDRTVQLQVNLAKLEEMNQLQDVFLHAIAHDLRTTIMGTLMILNNLQQQSGEDIVISRQLLHRMVQSGEIQLCKLNSLLEVYVNKTEGVKLKPVPLQINQLLQTVVNNLDCLFQQNQAKVDYSHLNDLPFVMADSAQLERVLRHLLVNAIKHNPPGVHINIHAEIHPEGICCIIEDDGKGIPKDQTEQLFELKIRGGAERQRTGISVGLCLCHQIVVAHGGSIGVESSPGQGSRFWFTLPSQSTHLE